MRISRTLGWMLALQTIVPTALAAQTTHHLSMNDHVRVQYAVGTTGGSVVGDVARLTQDSLGLALGDDRTMNLAWADIATASVWKTQQPERYVGGLMGGVLGALVGGFAAVNRDQSNPVGGELSGWTVGKGAALGAAVGALAGVGVAQLFKPHRWQRVDVRAQVAAGGGGLGLSVAVGR